MPVNNDEMKTMTTIKICQLTPIAAFALKPTRLPTSAWSTMPCKPPMAFVSIVGHAIFHTAGRSGPSIIDRSYRGLAATLAASGAAVATAGADATFDILFTYVKNSEGITSQEEGLAPAVAR